MRYLLFGKDEIYYASGGANDYLGSADSLDALINSVVLSSNQHIRWWHVFDTETREIVAGTKTQAYSAPSFEDGL